MKKRNIVCIAMSALMLLTMSGCRIIYSDVEIPTPGSTSSETSVVISGTVPSKEREEKKLSGKLEIQLFTNETQSADKGWTQVINAFEEETGVKVTVVMGSQVNTQMTTRWMNDNPPDIIWIDGTGIPDVVYESGGKFKDVTDILENGYVYGRDTKISDVLNTDVQIKYEGKAYRAPILVSTQGIWYDANYMRANDLTVPTNYDELLALAQTANNNGTAAFTYPGQYASYCLNGLIVPAIAAYGQEYLDSVYNAEPEAFASDNMKSILQRYSDFCRVQGSVLRGTTTMDHTTSQVQWINHKSLLIANGLWLPDETRKSTPTSFDMTYSASPLVEASQEQSVVLFSKNIAIAEKAKNAENAEAFLRFLYREETQVRLMSAFGYMSVRTDLDYKNATASMNSATAKALQYINEGDIQICYNRGNWGDVGDIFSNILNELTMGSISVDEAQKQLVKAAQKEK